MKVKNINSKFESLDSTGPARCKACGELVPGWAKQYHLTECPKRVYGPRPNRGKRR